MGNLRISDWRKLPVSLAELCIDTTLRSGQSFRWKKLDDEWICALHGRILSLKQDAKHLHYRATWPTFQGPLLTPPRSATPSTIGSEDGAEEEEDDTEALLREYFNLDVNLSALYEQWSQADTNFKQRAPQFTGVRMLRQDAWEALVGFICSSCNNIPRIMQMIEKLCLNYGTLLNHVDGRPFYDFPTPENLAGDGVEACLRELGFGYRAKYLAQTAKLIATGKPHGWLGSLSNPNKPGISDPTEFKPGGRDGYRLAHAQLLKLQGVGPKVADCVCLMGLGWSESVPVDTHVWQIAQRDYKFGKGKHKSLTKATYDAVADHFRGLWGEQAGWAQAVLFAAVVVRVKSEVKEELDEVKTKSEEGGVLEELSMKTMGREFDEEKVIIGALGEEKTIKREFKEEETEVLRDSTRSQRSKRRRGESGAS